jgi:hypothetical protein
LRAIRFFHWYVGEETDYVKTYKVILQGLLEKSKVAQHEYEEGHKICWNEAKVLQIEPNTAYRK